MGNPEEEKLKQVQELRGNIEREIDTLVLSQTEEWDAMKDKIQSAYVEYTGQQWVLAWKKINEIANTNGMPLWMDAVLIIATTIFPVESIISAGVLRMSNKLLRIPIVKTPQGNRVVDEIFLNNPAMIRQQLGQIQAQRIRQAASMQAHVERATKWIERLKMYQPEVESNLRSLVTVISKMAVQPLFDKDVTAKWIENAQKPENADNTGLPVSDVYDGLTDWVRKTKFEDLWVLQTLKNDLKNISNLESLKAIREYISNQYPGLPATRIGTDKFRRFVEACFWCTTYDFTVKYVPAGMQRRGVKGVKWVPAHFDLLPFPDTFWEYLIKRHYDIFGGDGNQTYEDVGRTRYITKNLDEFSPLPPDEYQFQKDMETNKIEFDPKVRLCLHWSQILAPALLCANKEMATVIEQQLSKS